MSPVTSLCATCGETLPEVGSFCPACGSAKPAAKVALGTTGGIPDRIAGALAYVLMLPAIFFLLKSPFKRNRFIRFHAWQSILLAATTLILFSLLILTMGRVVMIFVSFIVALGWFILWLLLIVKALQGEIFELPFLGRVADRQSS